MPEENGLESYLQEIFRSIFGDSALLSVRSLDKERGTLHNEFRWQKEPNQDMPETDDLIPVLGTISGRAIERKEAIHIPEIDKEPLFYPRGIAYVAAGYVSMMAVPLFDFNSEVIGVVQVYTNIRGHQFNKKEEKAIRAVCKMMEHMILSRQLEEKKTEFKLHEQTLQHAREVHHHIRNKALPMGGFARRALRELRREIRVEREKMGTKWRTEKYLIASGPIFKSLKYLTIIAREAKRLEDALADVLNFGSSALNVERTEIINFLRPIIQRSDHKSENGRAQIDLQIHGDIFVNIDRRKMDIVAQELLNNARKAAEKSGSKNPLLCRIFHYKQQERNSVCFEVINDGEISPEIRDQIFDPFFTTDRQCGTGLGLSLAKLAIEQHGGAIGVESSGGKTSARIYIPIAS
jgi:signal transduction histidine kinase